MRWTMVSLCLLMAACGNQNLNSPTSPTSALSAAAVSRDAAGAGQTQARSGTELPFQGSFTRRTQAVFEPPNTLVISGTEAGAATYLGQFTAVSEIG